MTNIRPDSPYVYDISVEQAICSLERRGNTNCFVFSWWKQRLSVVGVTGSGVVYHHELKSSGKKLLTKFHGEFESLNDFISFYFRKQRSVPVRGLVINQLTEPSVSNEDAINVLCNDLAEISLKLTVLVLHGKDMVISHRRRSIHQLSGEVRLTESITSQQLWQLRDALVPSQMLTCLTLDKIGLTDETIPLVVEIIAAADQLQTFVIKGNKITDNGFRSLAYAVAIHPQLTSFVCCEQLTVDSLASIAEIIKNNHRIRTLQFADYESRGRTILGIKSSNITQQQAQKVLEPVLVANTTLLLLIISKSPYRSYAIERNQRMVMTDNDYMRDAIFNEYVNRSHRPPLFSLICCCFGFLYQSHHSEEAIGLRDCDNHPHI